MADNAHTTTQHNEFRNAGSQGAEAARAGAQAAQQGGKAEADAIRRTGDVAAEASRRAGEAGARAAETATETVQRSAEAFADSHRELVQNAAERFQEVSQKVAEATQRNIEHLRALMTLPNAAQGGLQDLQQSVVGLIEGVVRTNLRATQELFQLANPAAYVELQQRFTREYLDTVTQGTATLVRATRRTADETLRPLEQQIEQRRRQQHDNQSQGFSHAAE